MNYRTDLAVEQNEILTQQGNARFDEEYFTKSGVNVTRITVSDGDESKNFGKPAGTYITAEVEPFTKSSELFDGRLDVIAQEISSLLPKEGLVLVAGLGNCDITPDALGPRCIDFLISTRHIDKQLADDIGFEKIRPVAAVVPGVLGKTGIETGEMLKGIVQCVHPVSVITIDALAARNLSRLGNTIQISNAGIAPGSGVGNRRKGIDKQLLGVDVISIGVPTVVDAATLAKDVCQKEIDFKTLGLDENDATIVTPCQIDLLIERAAKLIGMSINHALQPDMKCEDLLSLVT